MLELNSPEMVQAMNALENEDHALAFRLFNLLAEAGNAKAQCNLATLYHFGLGVEADGKKAVELYRGVAEQEILEEHLSGIAYNNLATIYICGFPGIEPDPQRARDYRDRAKALGFEM